MTRNKTVYTSSVGRTIYHRSGQVSAQPPVPQKPKKTLRVFAFVALVTLLGVGIQNAYSSLAESDFFRMSYIKVEGNHLLPEQDVIDWSQLEVGENLFTCDLEAVTKRIEEQSIVKRVLLRREPPETVVISLEERQPVALVATPIGLMGLDVDGQLFSLPQAPVDLPILTHLKMTKDSTGVYHSKKLLVLTKFVTDLKNETPEFWNEISEIQVTTKNAVTVFLVGDQLTLHMHLENPKQQVQNFRAYTQASSRKIADLAYIDLRFENQVVVGRR